MFPCIINNVAVCNSILRAFGSLLALIIASRFQTIAAPKVTSNRPTRLQFGLTVNERCSRTICRMHLKTMFTHETLHFSICFLGSTSVPDPEFP